MGLCSLQPVRGCPCGQEQLLAAWQHISSRLLTPDQHPWCHFGSGARELGFAPAPKGAWVGAGTLLLSWDLVQDLYPFLPPPTTALCCVPAAPSGEPSRPVGRVQASTHPPALSGSRSSLGSEQGAALSASESCQSDHPPEGHDSDVGSRVPGKLMSPLLGMSPCWGLTSLEAEGSQECTWQCRGPASPFPAVSLVADAVTALQLTPSLVQNLFCNVSNRLGWELPTATRGSRSSLGLSP